MGMCGFHLFASVNNTSMNLGVYKFLLKIILYILGDLHPEAELLNYMVILF